MDNIFSDGEKEYWLWYIFITICRDSVDMDNIFSDGEKKYWLWYILIVRVKYWEAWNKFLNIISWFTYVTSEFESYGLIDRNFFY